MESSKRKRAAADDTRNGGDQRRLRGEERGRKEGDRNRDRDRRAAAVAVDDAEVEEFYAIMQRVRATSRCIAVGDSDRRTEAERFRWRPAFVWEDFEGGASAAVKDDGGGQGKEVSGGDKEEEEEEVRVRGLELDLNADPEPEGGELTGQYADLQA